ncbi:DMT family transporter [Cognatiyoonia sp. IB215446]|uniref:DMT family transporter n=1 Tax=Cognatiyoonia sp. IB215446 TaxID=3097355 RepID=UPI002A11FAB8|nr:DMT family transporter [Cognatiyoonia sp. IB215446]MDX8347132.1 DMT family transporter [Cognatiyoonia sp. IB215446]
MTPAQLGHLAMLLFSLLVAGSFALGALVANEIAPLALNAVRFWIAAAVIGLAVFMTTGLPAGATKAPWRYIALAGFFTTYFVLMFEGLKTAPPVSAAAVFTLTPILSAGFGWLILRQVLTPRMGLALAIGAAGAVWVIFRADLQAILQFRVGQGEVIYFWGCVAHAIYTPLVRKLNRGEPAIVFTFGVLLAGAVMLTIIGWRDLQSTDWGNLPALVWITILYTAIFASAATFVLLQFATLRLPSAKVMAYTYLTPSWVIVWTLLLGSTAPPALVLAGVGLTVIALILLLKNEED